MMQKLNFDWNSPNLKNLNRNERFFMDIRVCGFTDEKHPEEVNRLSHFKILN
jgi:hypothetical protein